MINYGYYNNDEANDDRCSFRWYRLQPTSIDQAGYMPLQRLKWWMGSNTWPRPVRRGRHLFLALEDRYKVAKFGQSAVLQP
jgi:hypothetical protein